MEVIAPINYAQLYEQALQQKFSVGLSFSRLYQTPNNQRIRYMGGKTIQLPRIDVTGMVDVDRDNVGTYSRKVDNSWEPKILEHDREWSTLVDPMDIDETNMALSIANITEVFNNEEKLPELDKYMASKLYAEYTGFGGTPITTPLTVDNVLTIYDDAMTAMDDAEVPQEGRILYVTPQVNQLLKEAAPIVRQFNVQQNAPTGTQINRRVRSLDDVEIVVVPSSRMMTVYDFTEGAVPDASAVQIHMILVHPLAIFAPMKYDFVDIEEPSATSRGKYFYYERTYWDVFAIERKVGGIQFVTDTP